MACKPFACTTKYFFKFYKKALLPHSLSKASKQTTEKDTDFKNQQIKAQNHNKIFNLKIAIMIFRFTAIKQ